MATKENPLSAVPVAEEISYREAPHNIEAEQALLGAILTNNDALNRMGDFLRPEHFYEPVHTRIFEAILTLHDRQQIANPVTLKHFFERDEALEDIGGASYLARIAGLASGIINVKDYAQIIYDLAVGRDLIAIGEEMVNDAYDNSGKIPASTQIEEAEHRLFELASEGSSEKYFAHLKHSLTESIERANIAAKRKGAISGVPTGFSDLDSMLGGFQRSDLIILAARPSMGKTALALNIALHAAESLKKEWEEKKKSDPDHAPTMPGSVGFFSMEMSAEQLAARLLSAKTGISSNSIRRGNLRRKPEDEFEKLVRANQQLYQLPFYIDDTPALSISALRTRARRLKRRHNLELLVIDYLQLARGVSSMAQSNRVQEVSEITMGLKAIAKELDIPVVALSQLSRQVEMRDKGDKRPQLSDLRESGSIEQDADIVMFIYREAYYLERKKPKEGTEEFMAWQASMDEVNNLAEIMIAKHRNGAIGNIHLYFDRMTTEFRDLADNEKMPEVPY